ncbi:hypothetical protein ACEPAG_7207 [Sanghuangporus baumii]
MAGDHKCPVCQATFTRPQHVARHMRSHTGDRPYKCQHCGDQFARSDLLSRHVNKCHAGDKPPTTTAPTRRKGGSSSTRATTSKQACDQCVIATLPCDGANPCSKCVQRKSPCTYVKFQRQTAPVGPGHRHSHSVESTSSVSSLIGSVPRPDELFLGPPPLTVPSMGAGAGELFYPAQFAFNAPPGAQNWDSDSSNPPSLSFSGTDSGADSSSSDPARYRDPAFSQTGYPPGMAGGGTGFAANSNPYYSLQSQQQGQQTVAPTDAWQFPTDFRLPLQRKMDEGFAQYLPASSSAQFGGSSAMVNPTNLEFNGNGSSLYGLHARRGSVGAYSDGSGFSAPNSAASSSTHLPLEFDPNEQSQGGQQIQPLSMLYHFDDNQQAPPSREGRVASSFGLMSLADGDQPFIGNFNSANNNVNVDGTAPFFTQHAMKLPPQDSTPRPFRDDENRTVTTPRDREQEMRELKEFWKQYLRTPLTGSSLGATPKAELLNNQLGSFGDGSRPTPKRGLSRVASLPSVRTPPDEKNVAVPSRVTNSHSQSHVQLPALQNNEDLKSYEQAVLARKPLNLTFVPPRKGRHSISSSASPQPAVEHSQLPGASLANLLMYPRPGPLAALSSTDGGNSSDDNPGPTEPSLRPGFKRLASQTLENSTQKRTMFRWGESEDVLDDSESDADGPSDAGSPPNRFDGLNSSTRTSSMSPSSYHRNMQAAHSGLNGPVSGTETLLDRFRRQSAPSGLRPNISAMEMTNGKMDESSPSPVSYAASPLQASHVADNTQLSASRPGLTGVDGNALVQT